MHKFLTTTVACSLGLAVSGSAWAAEGSAYVYANQATAGSYVAKSNYTRNPTGKAVQITRQSVGTYQVTLEGMGAQAAGGNMQVSSYGSGPNFCNIVRWVPTGPDLVASVRCYAGDRPADSNFTMLFTPPAGAAPSASVRYAWAGQPKAAEYPAAPAYASNRGQGVSVRRTGTGAYLVSFAGVPKDEAQGGNIQVTGYGADPVMCKVVSWTAGANALNVKVACFRGAAASDAAFSLLFTP